MKKFIWLPLMSTSNLHEEIAVFSIADTYILKCFLTHSPMCMERYFVFLWYSFVMSWSWLGLWCQCSHRKWLWLMQITYWLWDIYMEYQPQFTFYFVIFLYIQCYKRDYKCTVLIRGTQDFALANVTAHADFSCRISHQGTTLHAFDIHSYSVWS